MKFIISPMLSQHSNSKKFVIVTLLLFIGSLFIAQPAYADRDVPLGGVRELSGGGGLTLFNSNDQGANPMPNEYFSKWQLNWFNVQTISSGDIPTGVVGTGLCGTNYVHNDFDYPLIFGPQPNSVTSSNCQNNADLFLFADPGKADISVSWNATLYYTCLPGYSGNPCVGSSGTIQVQSQLATNVDITGTNNYFGISVPADYSAVFPPSGMGTAPAGTYTISGFDVACYNASVRSPGTTQTLTSGGVVFFIIDYTSDGSCGGSPPPPPPPPSPPPTADIRVNDRDTGWASGTDGPYSISSGSTVYLMWQSTNATSCTVTWPGVGTWTGTSKVTPAQSAGPITSNTTFAISCAGPGGSASDSVTVNIGAPPPPPPPPPTVTLSAFPNPVAYNTASTLTWSSTNATSCTASDGWSGSRAIGGAHTETTGNFTSVRNYSLVCFGPGGDTTAFVSVGVGGSTLTATLTATPASGNSPLAVNLTASVAGSATGPIDYSLWWDCNSATTNRAAAVSACGSLPSVSPSTCSSNTNGLFCNDYSPTLINDTHTYTGAGGRRAKVIVERGTASPAQAQIDISVGAAPVTLTTSINSGSGTISGPGINCPGDCSEAYPSGTPVQLTATAGLGYDFDSWSGACAGHLGTTCSIPVMNSNKTVGVNFSIEPPPFNYSLSAPGTVIVTKGSSNVSVNKTVTKNLISGTPENVFLSLVPPSGVSYAIAPNNNFCNPTCNSTITFTVSPTAPVGDHTIIVTGSPLNETTQFTLRITGNPMTVTCSASPATSLIGQTVTWTAVVSGGTPPFTYSWSGTNIPTSPAPSANPYSISYSTIGQKTTTVTVTDADGLQASFTSSVQINFDPQFEEF